MSEDVLLEMLGFIMHQTEFIIETTSEVKDVDELLVTTTGMVLYNSTCMCLQTIGETVKKIDDLTDKVFFSVYYPQIPWRAIIGMRNIISHEYSATDPEKVFNTAKVNIPELLPVIETIINDVEAGRHDIFSAVCRCSDTRLYLQVIRRLLWR